MGRAGAAAGTVLFNSRAYLFGANDLTGSPGTTASAGTFWGIGGKLLIVIGFRYSTLVLHSRQYGGQGIGDHTSTGVSGQRLICYFRPIMRPTDVG